jgi:hypothetical protein
MGAWTELIWLRIGRDDGLCECNNEPAGFKKCREFLDWLMTYQYLRKDLAP